MTEFEAPAPNSSLGDKLLDGVRNLWGRVQAIENASDRAKKLSINKVWKLSKSRFSSKRYCLNSKRSNLNSKRFSLRTEV